MNAGDWYVEMMAWEGTEMTFEVRRGEIEEGRTISAAAMEELHSQIVGYVGSRVMRRWDATGEPPTVVRVDVTVIAS